MVDITVYKDKKMVAITDDGRILLSVQLEEAPFGPFYVVRPLNKRFRYGFELDAALYDELKYMRCTHLRINLNIAIANLAKYSSVLAPNNG